MWKSIVADGCTWDVRATGHSSDDVAGEQQEVLEFTPREANRPPRRVAVDPGAIEQMDEHALRSAWQRALPIGGDHYGRPGKRMGDVQRD